MKMNNLIYNVVLWYYMLFNYVIFWYRKLINIIYLSKYSCKKKKLFYEKFFISKYFLNVCLMLLL